MSRKKSARASFGKFLRVKSRYPESFRFLCLCALDAIASIEIIGVAESNLDFPTSTLEDVLAMYSHMQ